MSFSKLTTSFLLVAFCIVPLGPLHASGGYDYSRTARISNYNYYYPLSGNVLPGDDEVQDYGIISNRWDARLLFLVYNELEGHPLERDEFEAFVEYYTTSKSYESQYQSYRDATLQWKEVRDEVTGIKGGTPFYFTAARRHALGGLRPYSIIRATETLRAREHTLSQEELIALAKQYEHIFGFSPKDNDPGHAQKVNNGNPSLQSTPNPYVSFRQQDTVSLFKRFFLHLQGILSWASPQGMMSLVSEKAEALFQLLVPAARAAEKTPSKKEIRESCQEIFETISQPSDPSKVFREDQAYQCASFFFVANRFPEALAAYREIAEDNNHPWQHDATYMMGRTYALLGDYDNALVWLDRVDDPSRPKLLVASARRLRGYVEYAQNPNERMLDGLHDAFDDPIIQNRLVALEDFAQAWYAMYITSPSLAQRNIEHKERVEFFHTEYQTGTRHDFFEWVYTLHPNGSTPQETYRAAAQHGWNNAWSFTALMKDPSQMNQKQRDIVVRKIGTTNLVNNPRLRETIVYRTLLFESYDPRMKEYVIARAQQEFEAAQDPVLQDHYRSLVARVASDPQDFISGVLRNGAELELERSYYRTLYRSFALSEKEVGRPHVPDPDFMEVLFWNAPHAVINDLVISGATQLPSSEKASLVKVMLTRSIILGDETSAIRMFEQLVLPNLDSSDETNYWGYTKHIYGDENPPWDTLSHQEKYAYVLLFVINNSLYPVASPHASSSFWPHNLWCPTTDTSNEEAHNETSLVILDTLTLSPTIAEQEQYQIRTSQGSLVFLSQAMGTAEELDNPNLSAQLLSVAIRSTQYGSCRTKEKGRLAQRAFRMLHDKHGETSWAKATPYWFD